jgi:phosphohistidine phosphatase
LIGQEDINMDVYLMRHGPAVDIGENGVRRDSERMLSKDGRKRTELVARALTKAGVSPSRVFSSPLVRCVETAEAFIRETETPDMEPELLDELAPGLDCGVVTAMLARQKCEEAMLVGHAPDMAELAWYWIAGSGGVGMEMKKAGACCVSFEGVPGKGKGVLLWLVKPSLLEAAGDI